MDDLPIIGYLILAPFALCLVAAAITWFFAAYYMIQTLKNFHPQRQWGKFVLFSLFTQWFFTEEGNFYRVRLLKAGGLFFLFLALAAGFALGGKALLPVLSS